jgi:hypothetical protein
MTLKTGYRGRGRLPKVLLKIRPENENNYN